MKKLIEHLKQKNLWPDSLSEWVPHHIILDNDNGKIYVSVSEYKSDIRLIMNALEIDFESKPNLLNLVNKYLDLEWGITVNVSGPIYSMYIGRDSVPDAPIRYTLSPENAEAPDPLLQELRNEFPVPSIQLTRTRREYEDSYRFETAFLGIGLYYNLDTDEVVEYKHYYSGGDANPRDVHMYRMDGNKKFKEFDIETREYGFDAFDDTIGITKVMRPHLNYDSSRRANENKSYLGISTSDYENRGSNIIL